MILELLNQNGARTKIKFYFLVQGLSLNILKQLEYS